VSSGLLVHLLSGESSHRLPIAFCKAAGCLGGAKADLASHVSVALGVVRRTWNDISLSPTLRQAIVGNLLENLIRDRRQSDAELVLQSFDEFARLVLKNDAIRRYLRDWRHGHFL
jgi:hypothetical protein